MRHYDQDHLTLLYYAEENDDDHLAACPECRAQMQQLADTLDRLTEWPVPLRPTDYPARVWNALAPQLGLPPRRRAFPWLPAVAAAAAMLVLTFQFGRYTASTPHPISTSSDRIRDAAITDHLEQSRFVLAELVNAHENDPAGLSAERLRAARLLEQNRLLRQTAALAGMTQVADTLDDLERLLVEFSHAPDSPAPSALIHLRSRIEQQNLLFRVRILESQLRHKLLPKEDNL